ncbi:hypothetical protein MMC07_003604 [Pseudocyphellaria aurata]|nr:hypothetical protein [Pseudocyphellaria aurata]
MSPNDSAGRISKNVYLIAPTILFGFSVLFVIARTTIRLRYQKRLFIDDAFLFLAEICLCASVGLLYACADSLFLNEALITRPSTVVLPPDYLNRLSRSHKLDYAYIILTFTSIFAVKFSFLFFFRILVRRIHKMSVYWWVAVTVTTVAWVFCVLEPFIFCPYFDERLDSCKSDKSDASKEIGFAVMVTILDIMTDVLIIVIPVQLLWNVRIKRRQKIILGATLCLSIVMVLTAIVRISAILIGKDQVDMVWANFWQIIENCLAVMVVCLSAFRSVFVGTQARAKRLRNKQWYEFEKHSQMTRKRKNWMDIETEEIRALPKIPRPTMMGLKTFKRGKPHPEESIMHSQILDESNDKNTLHDDRNPTKIRVDYSISHETEQTTNGNQQSRA